MPAEDKAEAEEETEPEVEVEISLQPADQEEKPVEAEAEEVSAEDAPAQEKPEVYEVVEVGPGGMVEGNEVKMIVKAGEKVLVGKYSGTKVKLDEVEYTIVRQSDILAVIE